MKGATTKALACLGFLIACTSDTSSGTVTNVADAISASGSDATARVAADGTSASADTQSSALLDVAVVTDTYKDSLGNSDAPADIPLPQEDIVAADGSESPDVNVEPDGDDEQDAKQALDSAEIVITDAVIDAGPVAPPCECDDENLCTSDKCDDAGECVFIPVPLPCEDGNPCLVGDVCNAGKCESGTVVVNCDDGNPCTADDCVEFVGCAHQATNDGGECDSGNLCSVSDQCQAGECVEGDAKDCDDNDVCTVDSCVASSGDCSHTTEKACDDGISCTEDSCDKALGCQHQSLPDGSQCQDADPCTVGDVCTEGQCVSGIASMDCDDGNDCTSDACVAFSGCEHTPVTDSTVCDDGNADTSDDVCVNGQCKGKGADCFNAVDVASPTLKVTELAISQGPGLDVDGDGKNDNALSIVGVFITNAITEAVKKGTLMMLSHLLGFNDSQPFPIYLFNAALDASNGTCSFQTAHCDYVLDPLGFNDSCEAVSVIKANTWDGKKITTLESGTVFLNVFIGGSMVVLPVYKGKMDVSINFDETGEAQSFAGLLGGAVKKTDLIAAMSKIPDLAPIISLLSQIVQNDIDTTGDGTKDAVSLALNVNGIGGEITGVIQVP